MCSQPIVRRRPETGGDEAFRFALFCDSRPQAERLTGLDPALAAQLMRHQFAGQEAGHRAAYPNAHRDIVEAEGAPVGRIVVDRGAQRWTVVDIALLAAWRSRGTGAALLREVMEGASAAGCGVRLSVMAHNAGARRLYARLGFGVVSTEGVELAMEWMPSLGGSPVSPGPGPSDEGRAR